MQDTKSDLANVIVNAYGGDDRWSRLRSVSFHAATTGVVLPARFQFSAFRNYTAEVHRHPPEVLVRPHPRPGQVGIYTVGAVRITDTTGNVIAERSHPRDAFSNLRHRLWWDALDALHFAGYALWNYFFLPALLRLPGMHMEEIDPWEENGESWRRLRVAFPETVVTHNALQIFYADEQGFVRRHDYTAEVFGSWANAAHYSDGYERHDGLVFPTRRRVYPRKMNNRPRRWMTLVGIDITEIQVDLDERTAEME